MEKRYPALHIISLLFKVLAIVVVVLGIILIIAVVAQGDTALSFAFLPKVFGSGLLTLGIVPIILFTLVSALILWGVAELVVCLIDIENNTRIMMTLESKPKETPVVPAAVVSPATAPATQPAQAEKPVEDTEEKKAAAALAERKQNLKDILNKKIW